MSLEINLETIVQTAKDKSQENLSFASYLKVQDSDKIDNIIHKLSADITPKIDCVECGNCCHNIRPVATREEVGLFVEPENIDACMYLEGFVCKNLDGNKCTIYVNRHDECRLYPYLHRFNFVTRTSELLTNYEYCPIVFNVMESLKKELSWTYK